MEIAVMSNGVLLKTPGRRMHGPRDECPEKDRTPFLSGTVNALLIAPTVQFNPLVILTAWQLHQHQLAAGSRQQVGSARESEYVYIRTHAQTHHSLPLPRRRILQKLRVISKIFDPQPILSSSQEVGCHCDAAYCAYHRPCSSTRSLVRLSSLHSIGLSALLRLHSPAAAAAVTP
jgi:hypothetical protein